MPGGRGRVARTAVTSVKSTPRETPNSASVAVAFSFRFRFFFPPSASPSAAAAASAAASAWREPAPIISFGSSVAIRMSNRPRLNA